MQYKLSVSVARQLGHQTFDQAAAGSTPGHGAVMSLGQLSLPSLRGKSRRFISRLFAIQIAAEPLYNTPLVHWTLCLLPHYGALA